MTDNNVGTILMSAFYKWYKFNFINLVAPVQMNQDFNSIYFLNLFKIIKSVNQIRLINFESI